MNGLGASLRFNLRRLLAFSGRENRGQFWPYAICVVIGSGIVGMLVALPMLVETMMRTHEIAVANADDVRMSTGPGQNRELVAAFSAFMTIAIGVNITVLGLLAAAVTRRLHDCDRRGWWGLLPLPFAASAVLLMRDMFGGVADPMNIDWRMMLILFAIIVVYLAVTGFLILMLATAGTNGPNRFGPEPRDG